jgi:hypothetical protein
VIFLVSYDLKKPGQDYTGVYEAIKSASGWWHYLESTWIIQTNRPLEFWADKIKSHMDANDRLIIVDITNSEYNGWLPAKAWEWIKAHKT